MIETFHLFFALCTHLGYVRTDLKFSAVLDLIYTRCDGVFRLYSTSVIFCVMGHLGSAML
jgi:hypothetical protein